MLALTDFRINTSYLAKTQNGKWCITNSKVKVEINDGAISKSFWLLEKICWIYYM